MNEDIEHAENLGSSVGYASVYDEIIRKRRAAGGNMAMGKHAAANATCCQRVIEDLQAVGFCNIADWAIWMLWWRMMDSQTAKNVDEMRLEEIAELRQRIDALGSSVGSSSAGGKGGCRLAFVQAPHDRKCDACEMHSATLYELHVGQAKFRICCFCKSNIHSGIEQCDGPDDL